MVAIEVVRRDLAPVLEAEGFARVRRSNSWMRREAELVHVWKFEARNDHVQVQWGVLSEAVLPQLWLDPPSDAADRVEYSAMTGWLANMPGQLRASVNGVKDAGLAEQTTTGAAWLRQFTRRAELVSYLLEVDDPKDRRGFIVPTNLPLKLQTCAFLLSADGSPDARALAARALDHFGQHKDPLSRHRFGQLKHVANLTDG